MTLNYSSLSTQEVVDLCGKKLKYDEVKLIIKVLKKSKGKVIKTLKMSNNQLTLENTEFTNALATNDTLQNLYGYVITILVVLELIILQSHSKVIEL